MQQTLQYVCDAVGLDGRRVHGIVVFTHAQSNQKVILADSGALVLCTAISGTEVSSEDERYHTPFAEQARYELLDAFSMMHEHAYALGNALLLSSTRCAYTAWREEGEDSSSTMIWYCITLLPSGGDFILLLHQDLHDGTFTYVDSDSDVFDAIMHGQRIGSGYTVPFPDMPIWHPIEPAEGIFSTIQTFLYHN